MPTPCRFFETWDEVEALRDPATQQLPIGAMFYLTFSGGHCENHDPPCERHLVVICPNGHWWNIDSRCSNCTLKDDKAHRCWVRHGEPPNITVDKNGLTCSAGAGSIQAGDYHGFLQNGSLT